jgi:hypothetical protein
MVHDKQNKNKPVFKRKQAFSQDEDRLADHRLSRYFKIFGFLGLTFGFIIPFLIVIKVILPTFFLMFFSHTISILGIFSAMLGITAYAEDILRPR